MKTTKPKKQASALLCQHGEATCNTCKPEDFIDWSKAQSVEAKNLKESPKWMKQLVPFMEYLYQHPNERFWQALRNWSGAEFVYIQMPGQEPRDTFYDE